MHAYAANDGDLGNIRRTITRCVIALPLKRKSHHEIVMDAKKTRRGWVVTSLEETQGSWIAGSLDVPTWLHHRSDHSILSCRTE
jgi:hypothetical protein